ncbi:MAG: Holliday junction resolvase RuvX [Chlorobi bacterium]|nr:Holliday junction resolvase RuvX [Chlorobiota bacterium]
MNDKEQKRILAIDFGEKRIGIAVSDPLRMFAIPIVTLSNDKSFFRELRKLFERYSVEKILLGYPLKENNEKSSVAGKVEKFQKKLSVEFKDIPIEYVDERYSSQIAVQHIIAGVKSKKKRRDKSLIDKNAAAVILEDYLRTEN